MSTARRLPAKCPSCITWCNPMGYTKKGENMSKRTQESGSCYDDAERRDSGYYDRNPGTSKHTPGPWRFIVEDNAVVAHPAEYDLVVAMVHAPVRDFALDRDNGSHEGNARLIATAPDMADALGEARKFADWCLKNAGTLHRTDIQMYAIALSDTVAAALNKAGLGES